MSKIFRLILEYTWLGVAVLSLGAGVHKTYKTGFGESYLFFIIVFISILMYMFRRHMRKSQDKKG